MTNRLLLAAHVSVFLLLVAGACSSGEVDNPGLAAGEEAATASEQPTSSSSATASTATAASATETTPTTAATVESTSSTSVESACRTVADLEDEAELARWRIVNDGVMGGQSSAQAELGDSTLTITGEIVTDGGGFSSARLDLDEPLGDASELVFRIRTDGRAYELTAADAAAGRDRRVAHQGPIPAIGGSDWEEVSVDLTALDASIFGRPVVVDPFDPAAAVEIGIILADGQDGPFRFDLDWIQACR